MFHKTINMIKLNYILKRRCVKLTLNKNDMKIIKILLQLNIISMVKKNWNTKNSYTVFFKYLKGEPVFNSILNLYKPSKPVFIGLKELCTINKKKIKIFILSTNKGLITNFDAEQKKLGGVLVLSIQI